MKVDKTVRIRVGIEEHRTMDIKADELVRIEEHKKVDTEVHIVMGKAWEDKQAGTVVRMVMGKAWEDKQASTEVRMVMDKAWEDKQAGTEVRRTVQDKKEHRSFIVVTSTDSSIVHSFGFVDRILHYSVVVGKGHQGMHSQKCQDRNQLVSLHQSRQLFRWCLLKYCLLIQCLLLMKTLLLVFLRVL